MLWFDTCASRTLQAASIGGTSPRTVAMRGWLDTPPTVPSVTDLPNSNTIVTSGASRFSNGSHDLHAINDGVADFNSGHNCIGELKTYSRNGPKLSKP